MAQAGRRRRPARDAVPGGWQARLTRVIAGEVRRYRKLRGLSVQELAERCEQLGLSMPRPVLSNLENGRRDSVSVAELLVLAGALEIPFLLLVAPVGRNIQVEVLPDIALDPWEAVHWFSGDIATLKIDRGSGRPGWSWQRKDHSVIRLYRRHDRLTTNLLNAVWKPMVTEHRDRGEQLNIDRQFREPIEEELRHVRDQMRELDLIPPPLPYALAYIDSEVRPGG